jgi:hypothetical protein
MKRCIRRALRNASNDAVERGNDYPNWERMQAKISIVPNILDGTKWGPKPPIDSEIG